MKRYQIFLIAALVALTNFAHAQLSIETSLGSALAYTDAANTRLGSHLGVRIDYALPVTPTTQLGLYAGGFIHHLDASSFRSNRAYGELGARVSTGNRLKLFGEAGIAAEPNQRAAANIVGAGGISWSTQRNIVLGAKLSAQRSVHEPDGLDGVISGNSDVIITPQIFIRVPLFKKQRQRNIYKSAQPQPQPVQDIQTPAPVYDYAGVRENLLRDSTFGNTIVQAINMVTDYKLLPIVKQQERQDSILFLKQFKLEQRLKSVQEQIDTQRQSQQQSQLESFGQRFYFKTGSSSLSDTQIAQISQLVNSKRGFKGKWHIVASSSNTGQKQSNWLLASKRADAVKAILPKFSNIETIILNGSSANVAEQYVQLTFISTQ